MAAVFASYIKANQQDPEWQSRLHHTKISPPARALLIAAPFCFEICGSPQSFGMDWIKINKVLKSLFVWRPALSWTCVAGFIKDREEERGGGGC